MLGILSVLTVKNVVGTIIVDFGTIKFKFGTFSTKFRAFSTKNGTILFKFGTISIIGIRKTARLINLAVHFKKYYELTPKNFFIFDNIPLSSSNDNNGTDSPRIRLAILR